MIERPVRILTTAGLGIYYKLTLERITMAITSIVEFLSNLQYLPGIDCLVRRFP